MENVFLNGNSVKSGSLSSKTANRPHDVNLRPRTEFLSRLVGMTSLSEIARLAFEYIISQMPCDAGTIVLKTDDDLETPVEVIYSFDTGEDGQIIIDQKREPLLLTRKSNIFKVFSARDKIVIHRTDDQCLQPINTPHNISGFGNKPSRSRAYMPL